MLLASSLYIIVMSKELMSEDRLLGFCSIKLEDTIELDEENMNSLSSMKCTDYDIVYLSYVPMQITDEKNACRFEKAVEESAKQECCTRYSLTIDPDYASKYAAEALKLPDPENNSTDEHAESNSRPSAHSDYAVLSFDQWEELGKRRIDESKDSEWQCPACKHRVKNLQREMTKDGSPCWGC